MDVKLQPFTLMRYSENAIAISISLTRPYLTLANNPRLLCKCMYQRIDKLRTVNSLVKGYSHD